LTEFKLLTKLELLTELKLEAELEVSSRLSRSTTHWAAMGNSFGSYSQPGTRHDYQAEAWSASSSSRTTGEVLWYEMMTTRPNSDGGGATTWEVAILQMAEMTKMTRF